MGELISYPIPGKSLILEFDPAAARFLEAQAKGTPENRGGFLIGSIREGDPRWITIHRLEPVVPPLPASFPPDAIGYYFLDQIGAMLSSPNLEFLENSLPNLPFALAIAPQSNGQVLAGVYVWDHHTGFEHARDRQIAFPSQQVLLPPLVPAYLAPPSASRSRRIRLPRLPDWSRQLAIVAVIASATTWLYLKMGEPPHNSISASNTAAATSDSADRTREQSEPVQMQPSQNRNPAATVPARAVKPAVLRAVPIHQSPETVSAAPTAIARPAADLPIVSPKVIHSVAPATPRSVLAMLKGEARVDVTVKIDSYGRVSSARLSAISGGASALLMAEALKAAKAFTFQPAQENNRAVESTMVLTFRFVPPRK